MNEIWKTIDGTDGKFSVSNLGNVRRNEHYTNVRPSKHLPNGTVAHYKEKILKGSIGYNGYVAYTLWLDGYAIRKTCHRLVAEAFIPNPDNLPCVNHKDENPLNNNVDNLEWCTIEYNNNYGTRNEKLKKTSGIKVALYSLDGKLIKIWNSISEASLHFGCKTTSNIRRVCKQLPGRKTYRGFLWKYVDQKIIGDSYLNEQIANNKQELIKIVVKTFSKDEIYEILLTYEELSE